MDSANQPTFKKKDLFQYSWLRVSGELFNSYSFILYDTFLKIVIASKVVPPCAHAKS